MQQLIAPLLGMFLQGIMGGGGGEEAPAARPLQLTPGKVYEPPEEPKFNPQAGAALAPDFDWRRYVDERLLNQGGFNGQVG